MDCFTRLVERPTMWLQRLSWTRDIQEPRQTCGHVELFCTCWWLGTCPLKNPLLWLYTRRYISSVLILSPTKETCFNSSLLITLFHGISVLKILCVQFQIYRAQFSWPPWFSSGARKLISKILDPNPRTVSSRPFYPGVLYMPNFLPSWLHLRVYYPTARSVLECQLRFLSPLTNGS